MVPGYEPNLARCRTNDASRVKPAYENGVTSQEGVCHLTPDHEGY